MVFGEVKRRSVRCPLLISNPACREVLPRNPALNIPGSGKESSYVIGGKVDFSHLLVSSLQNWSSIDVFETLFLARETRYRGKQETIPFSYMGFKEPAGFRRGRVGCSLWGSRWGWSFGEDTLLDLPEVLELKKKCGQEGSYVVARSFITAIDPYTGDVLFLGRKRGGKFFRDKLAIPGGKVENQIGFGSEYGIDHFRVTIRKELEEEVGELVPSEGTKKGFVIVYLKRPNGAGVIDFTEVCILHHDNLWSLLSVMNGTALESSGRRKGYGYWEIYRYGKDVKSTDFLSSTAFVLERLFEDPDPCRVEDCEGMTALVLYDRLIIEARGLMAKEVDLYNLPRSRFFSSFK